MLACFCARAFEMLTSLMGPDAECGLRETAVVGYGLFTYKSPARKSQQTTDMVELGTRETEIVLVDVQRWQLKLPEAQLTCLCSRRYRQLQHLHSCDNTI